MTICHRQWWPPFRFGIALLEDIVTTVRVIAENPDANGKPRGEISSLYAKCNLRGDRYSNRIRCYALVL